MNILHENKRFIIKSMKGVALHRNIPNELFFIDIVIHIEGRSPRVFCDKFVTKFVTKFGDKFSESPNLVINFWPKLVTNVVINCIQ